MAHYTPLRYPGGKGKLAPFLSQVFTYNNLLDGTYIEPYAGGAGAAISLLIEGYAWDVVINDYDPQIYAFWWCLLNKTDELCKLIYDTPIRMSEWHRQYSIYRNPDGDILRSGFATFFLNRTNRSGILLGGVIGGKNQNGLYKIDARYNKIKLIERIQLIASHSKRIKVFNRDALELLNELRPSFKPNTLIYFDPPYYRKGKLLYRNSYNHEDHKKLSLFIKNLDIPWIVTYDNVDEIRDLYKYEKLAPVDVAYSTCTERSRGNEIMFYNNLSLPIQPYTSKKQKRDILISYEKGGM